MLVHQRVHLKTSRKCTLWMTDCPRHPADRKLPRDDWEVPIEDSCGWDDVWFCFAGAMSCVEERRDFRKTYREKEATCIDIEHMRIWTDEALSIIRVTPTYYTLQPNDHWKPFNSKSCVFLQNGSPAPMLRTPKRSAGRGVVGTGYMLYGHYRNTSLYRMFDCIKCICKITCMIHKLQKHNNYISVYIFCMSITVLMYTILIVS